MAAECFGVGVAIAEVRGQKYYIVFLGVIDHGKSIGGVRFVFRCFLPVLQLLRQPETNLATLRQIKSSWG